MLELGVLLLQLPDLGEHLLVLAVGGRDRRDAGCGHEGDGRREARDPPERERLDRKSVV